MAFRSISLQHSHFWTTFLLKVSIALLAFFAIWEFTEHIILGIQVNADVRIMHLLRGLTAAGVVVLLLFLFSIRRSGFEQEMQAICELLKDSKEGIIALDDSFQIISCNLRASELLGSTFSGNFANWLSKVKQLLPEKNQFEILSPSEEAHLKIVSLQNPGRGYLLLLQDVTQEKQLDEQILIAEKMAAFGRLAAGLAHEIGTPLNVISGRAEMLGVMYKDPNTAKHLAVIDQQIQRISSIIQQLISQVAEQLPASQTFSLNVSINTVLEYLKPNLEQKGVEIRANLQDDLPSVTGFPDQWEQVFIHLLLNALDSIERSDGLIQISSRFVDGKIEIAIADNGCGIPDSNLTRIFDPFFTTKEFGKGTGLGLSVTANIVHGAGGNIEVRSKPGQGTMFLLHVPAAANQGSKR